MRRASPTFAPPAALPRCGACNARAVSPRRPTVHASTGGGRFRRARRWGGGLLAAAALAAGGLLPARAIGANAPAATDANGANSKELRYDGRAELGGAEKMLSLALTGGAFAGLSMWAWRRNRADDELEQVRIKEEVERLEKLKAEFMDVEAEGDGFDDEDLQKALEERLGQTDADADADGEKGADGEEGTAEEKSLAEDGAESLDMLRRMWDATDDEKDAGSTGSSAPAAGQ